MLKISEDFYSIQCEGVTNGTPSYFVRLQGCNLMCGNPDFSKIKDTHDQKEINKYKDPKASWLCDTIAVFLHGNKTTNNQLEDRMREADYVPGRPSQLENITNGVTHLIWTGGEPTLQEEGIKGFLDHLKDKYPNNKVYSEIETNGTRLTKGFYGKYIQQINCSPKLLNSRNRKSARYKPDALKQINDFDNSWFKFVVSKERDIEEVMKEFVIPNNLDKRKIILMPGLDKQSDYFERTKWVYEMGKKYSMKAISRGHIAAWDKLTGV